MKTRYYEVRTYELNNKLMNRLYAICENVRMMDALDRYYITRMYCTVKAERVRELDALLGALDLH